MWLFTKHGFFSAVCARQGDGAHGQPVDTSRMMVRARLRPHLEALTARFPDELEGCEIVETKRSDYAFRLFVGKAAWTRVAAALAEEIDYDNFKDEVEKYQGDDGAGYHHALGDIWSVMYELQRR
ncbi:MAG: hypothetical protein AMXMBFR55_31340 [Gemmatimonadota bacterium]